MVNFEQTNCLIFFAQGSAKNRHKISVCFCGSVHIKYLFMLSIVFPFWPFWFHYIACVSKDSFCVLILIFIWKCLVAFPTWYQLQMAHTEPLYHSLSPQKNTNITALKSSLEDAFWCRWQSHVLRDFFLANCTLTWWWFLHDASSACVWEPHNNTTPLEIVTKIALKSKYVTFSFCHPLNDLFYQKEKKKLFALIVYLDFFIKKYHWIVFISSLPSSYLKRWTNDLLQGLNLSTVSSNFPNPPDSPFQG